jgi:hypothetical protein
VFYTLVQSAMHQLDGRRPSSRSIRDYSRLIDIYGDDIIVPVEYADVVVRYLESYALKVNVNKSFRNSHFRESCGGDFYKGKAVNPIYARTVPHDDARDWGASEVMSWNATADLFYMRGMWGVAQTIRTMLSRVVRRSIPRSRTLGPGLVHFSYLFTTHLRWNANLQCWKQKRLQYDPIKRKDDIDGDELACLNKWGQHVYARTGSQSDYFGDTLRRIELRRGIAPEQFGESLGRVRPCQPCVDAQFGHCSVCGVPSPEGDERRNDGLLQDLGSDCSAVSGTDPRPEESESELPHWGVTVRQPDPLAFLTESSLGLDFSSSTKRGSFKSKCRWVSLAG